MAPIFTLEIERFLNEDRHAILATNRRSGAAQLTPVWYLYEEDRIYVSAHVSTVKARNLRRDPAISLCVDGGRGDERYVVIYGVATFVDPGQPEQIAMRRRIIRKYHDSDRTAEQYYESIKDSPAVLIVVTPEKLISWNLD